MSSLKLTINDIINLNDKLPRLDSYLSKDGSRLAYDFDEQTAWNIGKNMRILNGDAEQALKKRDKKLREIAPEHFEDIEKAPLEIRQAFAEWVTEYGKTEVEVPGLLKIKRSSLRKAGIIPGTVLAALMPIIEDDGNPAEPAK